MNFSIYLIKIFVHFQSPSRSEIGFITQQSVVGLSDISTDTTLHMACKSGNLDIVQFIISQGEVKLNTIDEKKLTPLLYASRNGHVDIVK